MANRSGDIRDQRSQQTEGEARIPVHEERLDVEKCPTEVGEVQVRKTVQEEQQTIPVELRREEVNVERRDVDDRPASAGEGAFQEGTIRVPVRGEEAVVNKQAVVTGEVVVNKEQTTERQDVSGTVRRERIEADEDYDRARSGFQEHYTRGQAPTGAAGAQGSSRAFEDVEPHYRRGWQAGSDERYRQREWDDVEPDLRRGYEEESRGGGTWDQLRDAVREGFDRARGRGSRG